MDKEEAKLIKQAQKGDEKAITALLSKHYQFIYLYFLKVTMQPALAEDLTQETMTKAIISIRSYKVKKAAFSTWLIRIGTNVWLDGKRKEKRERAFQHEQQLRWSLRHEEDTDWIEVKEALAKLKDVQRIPVLLKHYYGYSYDEMALICEVPVGTVKSRVNAGMNQLRKELGHD
ncbi:RNA polymerase sigma factor SigY [Bacillus sp. JCM 19041]|uniref:RNA polymerase sigma factor SigY n=1 Tax=Bacillus sp. JCM 19041 TaxID=1460637 RepID=UPI0006D044BE